MKNHENEPLDVRISESEWTVLDVLWDRGAVSASQVTTSLKSQTGWSLGTVRSFLNRLVKKGVVRILDDEPINRFEAVYQRETLVRQESHGFLEKFFGGAFHAMVAHYLKNESISRDEIERLKKLLNEHEEQDNQKK